MRNGWKSGDWLVIDEESGMTRYASEVRRDWKGLYVTKAYADDEQPQDFIKPLSDPRPLPFYAMPFTEFDLANFVPIFIGETTLLTPRVTPDAGAAFHLYDPGIGEMEVDYSFFVR